MNRIHCVITIWRFFFSSLLRKRVRHLKNGGALNVIVIKNNTQNESHSTSLTPSKKREAYAMGRMVSISR